LLQGFATGIRRASLTQLALLATDAEGQEDDDGGWNQDGGEQKTSPAYPPTAIRRIHRRILGPRHRAFCHENVTPRVGVCVRHLIRDHFPSTENASSTLPGIPLAA
jgi:hypothetical protein